MIPNPPKKEKPLPKNWACPKGTAPRPSAEQALNPVAANDSSRAGKAPADAEQLTSTTPPATPARPSAPAASPKPAVAPVRSAAKPAAPKSTAVQDRLASIAGPILKFSQDVLARADIAPPPSTAVAALPEPASTPVTAQPAGASARPRGWGASPERLVAEYLEPRGSSLEVFMNARGDVAGDASQLDQIYPAGPAAIFNFYDPFTGQPYPSREGGIFHRIRPLGHRREGSAKFLQPRDSGTHVFFAQHPALDWPTILEDPTHPLILTEGETRSLAGAAVGLYVISITGVDCGQQDGKLHPDLARVHLKGRRIFFAFDSDVRLKADARKALHKLATLLRIQGAEVLEVAIPPNPDGTKQGLDDLLANHGPETFEALKESALTQPMEGAGEYEPPTLLADLIATDYPPTEWVWDSLILKGEVNLLYGDGGIGKSLLALHVGCAVAAGIPLFGAATMRMPVLGMFVEDGPGQVQQRARTILRDFKLDSKGSLTMKLWCQPGGDTMLAQIDDNGMVKELPRLHALRAELSELHDQGFPALLILDSMADLFALNESLRLPVNAALKQVLGGLCRDFGTTVLVLAHPSKSSMQDGTHYSGSTAYNNAVRQRLTLEVMPREKDDTSEGQPPRILKVAKSNYGPLIEKTLWYAGATISDVSFEPLASGATGERLRKAVVWAAVDAAQRGVPFTQQRNIPQASIAKIEGITGRRPTQAEVKRELLAAVHADPQQLRYMNGKNTTRAGYYPMDEDTAKALSRRPKKLGLERKKVAP